MTSDEVKLIAGGICLGVLISMILPAKILPLCVVSVIVWVNRKEIARSLRKMRN